MTTIESGTLRARRRVLLVISAAALVAAIVVGAMSGAFPTSISEVWSALLSLVGIGDGPADLVARGVLVEDRLPRVAMAVLVGGSMAVSGVVLQGNFANPLAEPGITGVTAGCAMGAVLYIVADVSFAGSVGISAAALLGGLSAMTFVYLASRVDGRTDVVTLILTGIAVNAFAGAVIGLMSYVASDSQLRGIVFWSLGSLANASWNKVAIVAGLGVGGAVIAWVFANALDLIATGDRQAAHAGVNVEVVRVVTLTGAALCAAGATAVAGQVLFVGLVVPHAIRMFIGPRHRPLIVASALVGATLLVVADVLARTAVSPAELPLGVLTAFVGAPVFFWQVRRSRILR